MTELEIHHLDVGQGDCCLIIVRDHDRGTRTVLIDCGGTKNGVDDLNASRNLVAACSTYRVTRIDVVVTTHYDRDHIGGLNSLLKDANSNNQILRNLFWNTIFFDRGEPRPHDIHKSIFNNMPKSPTNYGNYIDRLFAISDANTLPPNNLTRQTELMRGHPKVGGNLRIKNTTFTNQQNARKTPLQFTFYGPTEILRTDVLNWNLQEEDQFEAELHVVVANRSKIGLSGVNPKITGMKNDENNNSVCLLLKMGNFTYWFPGELEKKGEAQCVDALAALNVTKLSGMKIAHHGAHPSTSPEFMQALQPQIAVISCGPSNSYQHPSRSVLDFLEGEDYVKHVFLTGYGGDTEDRRNPKYRSPFSTDVKFQFAGSADYSKPGHVSLYTNSNDAALDKPQFQVKYYAQNFGYYATTYPKYQHLMVGDWEYVLAHEVMDEEENLLFKNHRLDWETGIISIMATQNNKEIEIAKLHPEGDWVELHYPNAY